MTRETNRPEGAQRLGTLRLITCPQVLVRIRPSEDSMSAHPIARRQGGRGIAL